ncbi:unnamed protein product [Ectocarpus sp. 12 AP-2014]
MRCCCCCWIAFSLSSSAGSGGPRRLEAAIFRDDDAAEGLDEVPVRQGLPVGQAAVLVYLLQQRRVAVAAERRVVGLLLPLCFFAVRRLPLGQTAASFIIAAVDFSRGSAVLASWKLLLSSPKPSCGPLGHVVQQGLPPDVVAEPRVGDLDDALEHGRPRPESRSCPSASKPYYRAAVRREPGLEELGPRGQRRTTADASPDARAGRLLRPSAG